MKNIAIGVISVIFFSCASVCSAAYLIHLKDGREITTHEYREEGDQIKIHQYGGVVGISKEDVLSIEEIDDPKTIIIKSPTEPSEKAPTQSKEEVKTSIAENGGQKEKERPKTPKNNAKEHSNEILNKFDSLRERFKNIESMSKEEIIQFDKDLAKLRDKMLKADIGGSYSDHLTDILSMGDKAEEVLKQKSQ